MKTWLIVGTAVVLAIGYGAYRLQMFLLYPSSYPASARTHVDTPDKYGMPFEDVTLTTQDGVRIRAFAIVNEKPAAAKTVLMLCPNAGNMGDRLPFAKMFYQMGYHVVTLSYRGYGFSEGTPSMTGIMKDCDAIVKYLVNHPVFANTSLALYGRSLGGAVAFYMAATYPSVVEAVIVENTFLSIPKMLPHLFPILSPFKFAIVETWPSEKLIADIGDDVPVLFLSGLSDTLVPPQHMRQLFRLCPSRQKLWTEFAQGQHNDTPLQGGYWSSVYEFLKQMEPIE